MREQLYRQKFTKKSRNFHGSLSMSAFPQAKAIFRAHSPDCRQFYTTYNESPKASALVYTLAKRGGQVCRVCF